MKRKEGRKEGRKVQTQTQGSRGRPEENGELVITEKCTSNGNVRGQ
jgi:hypothetical protein